MYKDFIYETWRKGRKTAIKDIVIYFVFITVLLFVQSNKNGSIFLEANRGSFKFFVLLYFVWLVFMFYSFLKYNILGYKKGCNLEAPYYRFSKEKLADKINEDIDKVELFFDDTDYSNTSDYPNESCEQPKLPYRQITQHIYLLSDYLALGTQKGKVIVIPISKLYFYSVKLVRTRSRYSNTRKKYFILFFTEKSLYKLEMSNKEEAYDAVIMLDRYLVNVSNRRDVLFNTMCYGTDDHLSLTKKLEVTYRFSRSKFNELVKYR